MVQIRRENKFADHGDNGTRIFEAIDSTFYGWGGVDHKFLILINASGTCSGAGAAMTPSSRTPTLGSGATRGTTSAFRARGGT